MPYLHYEMNDSRKQVTEMTQTLRERRLRKPLNNSSPEQRLVWAYMNSNSDLHCRRTLDQYYYPSIDTTTRDEDQVVYRETQQRWKGEDPVVVMVDQLWIVVLEGG
jgi:hypothetical protein